MGKTWKDLPQNVEGKHVAKRLAVKRKKPVRVKPKDDAEAEMLRKLYGDGGYVVEED